MPGKHLSIEQNIILLREGEAMLPQG